MFLAMRQRFCERKSVDVNSKMFLTSTAHVTVKKLRRNKKFPYNCDESSKIL